MFLVFTEELFEEKLDLDLPQKCLLTLMIFQLQAIFGIFSALLCT